MYRTGSSLALAALVCCVLAKEVTEIDLLPSQSKRCTYAYAFEMYGAQCAGLRLSKIPSLKSGIEILDFSDNKLQEVDGEMLSSYTSIKFLYLAENQIYDIKDDAFTSLTDLRTLDLSKNVILHLPASIFQLPYLQKLYLNGNPLIHMSLNTLASMTEIRAPLELLDISDCKIKVLPEWGLLPNLILYNISQNSLSSLEPKHFAGMCNLKKLDISKSIEEISVCKLKPSITWFQEKEVFFYLDDYTRLNSREYDRCPDKEFPEALNVTYHKCKSEYLQVVNRKASRRTWMTISGGLAGFLVGFILLLYVMHRHNVAQTKNADKAKNGKTAADKHTTKLLLTDDS